MDVLLTWVGSRDPVWDNPRTDKRGESGPILSLLESRPFDRMYTFVHIPFDQQGEDQPNDFALRATKLWHLCKQRYPTITTTQKPVELATPTDYIEIYRAVNATCQEIMKDEGDEDRQYFVYLSPGTPQMQTVWILLVQAGLLPARMIDASPPDLLKPGQRNWRTVDLSLADFPQVRDPGEAVRELGILQAQNNSLRERNESLWTTNQRLSAEGAVLRSGAHDARGGSIAEGFDLPRYLAAEKRRLYARAYEQAGYDASAAARLLGIPPHTFRQQAQRLGLRERQARAR